MEMYDIAIPLRPAHLYMTFLIPSTGFSSAVHQRIARQIAPLALVLDPMTGQPPSPLLIMDGGRTMVLRIFLPQPLFVHKRIDAHSVPVLRGLMDGVPGAETVRLLGLERVIEYWRLHGLEPHYADTRCRAVNVCVDLDAPPIVEKPWQVQLRAISQDADAFGTYMSKTLQRVWSVLCELDEHPRPRLCVCGRDTVCVAFADLGVWCIFEPDIVSIERPTQEPERLEYGESTRTFIADALRAARMREYPDHPPPSSSASLPLPSATQTTDFTTSVQQ